MKDRKRPRFMRVGWSGRPTEGSVAERACGQAETNGDPAFQPARYARSDAVFVCMAIAAGAIILYLGRSLTFWYDEWSSITFSGSAIDFFRPHNEHWSTLPLSLYRATFGVFQLHSYLPYLAELIVLHLLTVAGAYVLMRRRVGPLVATALAIPLLFLGAGSENLFWAFQTGFVGSVMFGLWGLVFIERSGRWSPAIASALLLAGLMSSGMGLVFLVAAFGRTVFDASLRFRVLAVVPPAAVYAVWYALLGREAMDQELAGPRALVRFVALGIAHSTSAFTGLGLSLDGRLIALVLFFALLIATGRAVIAGRGRALAAGCLLGAVAMYTLVGLVRGAPQSDAPTSGHYVYVAAFLLILSVADWLPEPWARLTGRPRLRATLVGVVVIALISSIAANIDALADNRSLFQFRADETRAYVALALAHRGESWVVGDPFEVQPSIPLLLETVEKHGSPLEDSYFPGVVKSPRAKAHETALLRIVGRGFRVEPATRLGRPVSASITDTEDVAATKDQGCLDLIAAGQNASVTVSVAGGTRVRVTARSPINGYVSLGRDWPPSRFVALNLAPRTPLDIVVPNTGDGGRWSVKLDLPAVRANVDLCPVHTG